MIVIDEIFLSSDGREKYFSEKPDGITDVIVRLKTGEQFIAPFFTYSKIWEMREKYEGSNQYLGGLYFWVADMIIIEKCEKELIRKVVKDLIEEGDFLYAFQKISNNPSKE